MVLRFLKNQERSNGTRIYWLWVATSCINKKSIIRVRTVRFRDVKSCHFSIIIINKIIEITVDLIVTKGSIIVRVFSSCLIYILHYHFGLTSIGPICFILGWKLFELVLSQYTKKDCFEEVVAHMTYLWSYTWDCATSFLDHNLPNLFY